MVPLILSPERPLPDWVGKVVIRIVDMGADEVELSVFDASGRIAHETWRVDSGSSFASVAVEILAALPTQDVAMPHHIGGQFDRLLEIKQDWRRLWIFNYWGAEPAASLFFGLPACALGIGVAFLAIPGGLPIAFAGVLGVPLGSVGAATLMTSMEAIMSYRRMFSRGARIRAAPGRGLALLIVTVGFAPYLVVPFVVPIIIALLATA